MNIDDYDLAMDDMPDARVFLIDGPAVRCGVGCSAAVTVGPRLKAARHRRGAARFVFRSKPKTKAFQNPWHFERRVAAWRVGTPAPRVKIRELEGPHLLRAT